MTVQEGDEIVQAREDSGQCRGIFFTSFRTPDRFRRREEIVESQQDVCGLCKRMARKGDREQAVCRIVRARTSQNIKLSNNTSLLTRPGVGPLRRSSRLKIERAENKAKKA